MIVSWAVRVRWPAFEPDKTLLFLVHMGTLSNPVLSWSMQHQPMHRHREARLIIFTAGSQSEETFDGTHGFGAGDILFRPSYFAHANLTAETGAVYVHVEIEAATARSWLRKHGWRAGLARSPFPSDQLRRLAGRPRLGDALLETVHVRPEAPELAMEKCCLTRTELSVAEAARRCGFAPYELSRRFRRRHGCTPRAYRNYARLHSAMRMLFEGVLSLGEIAQACDYFDQSHFNRAIKKETGLTPTALARAIRA